MYIYIYINDIRLKDPSGTSDLGFQVWTAVRLRIPGRTNPRSKIQYFQKFFLGSRAEILDPNGIAGSKISALDPRKVFWKYWILDLGSLQCQTCDFQVWTLFKLEIQVTETGVKPKTKHELQTKTLSKKLWCLSYVALSRFCCNAHPHPLRVAAKGSARYCIILNLVVHHPGRCLFFANVLMVLSTLIRKNTRQTAKTRKYHTYTGFSIDFEVCCQSKFLQ